jgi:outer membrane protein TolC
MRKTVFFLLLSWSITTLNAQIKEMPSSVSLEEAVEWGMIHNRTMQTANLELQKAQKQKWETLSIGFPQITANLNYQNNIEQPVSLIPAQFFGGQAGQFSEVTFGTKQTAMGFVEMRQLLFDGTYVVGVQGIKHFLEIADNVLEKTQLEVERIIVDSYVGALAAIANVEILERNIKTLSKNVEEAHQLFKSGFGEEESVEQLRITLASLNVQFDYANNMVGLTNSVMKLLLGISLENTLELSDGLEDLVLKNISVKTINSSYDNNIDLRIAENHITTEELFYRLEKAKKY